MRFLLDWIRIRIQITRDPRDLIEVGFLSIHTTLSSSALLYKEKGYMWFSIFINLVKGWPDKKNR